MGADFVEEAFKEIDEREKQAILADDRVMALIKSKSDRVGTLSYNGQEVRFRLSINKRLRTKLRLFKNKVDSDHTQDESEFMLYSTLASLCLDEPWNKWETWSVFDENAEEVDAMFILTEMMARIKDHMGDVKTFR